jgi:hypothetical protein|tara:strand:- start:40517 stop:41110 length:594 start_codon:yes stop_codon:yes gene_type:complete
MASRAVDLLIAYRVIKLLVTPFKNQAAFKTGIIDADGKVLKPYRLLKTGAEKSSYTMLHRFVFNLKRILGKVGLGGKIGSFAVALGLLLKEDKEFAEDQGKNIESTLVKILKEKNELVYSMSLNEEYFTDSTLKVGSYQLKEELFTGEEFLPKGTDVFTIEELKPDSTVLGLDIYKMKYGKDMQEIYVPGDYLDERK